MIYQALPGLSMRISQDGRDEVTYIYYAPGQWPTKA